MFTEPFRYLSLDGNAFEAGLMFTSEARRRILFTSNASLATVSIDKLLLLAVKMSLISTVSHALPCPSLDVGLPVGKTLPYNLTLNDPELSPFRWT